LPISLIISLLSDVHSLTAHSTSWFKNAPFIHMTPFEFRRGIWHERTIQTLCSRTVLFPWFKI